MPPDIARLELRACLLGALDETPAESLEARHVADAALVEVRRDEEDAPAGDPTRGLSMRRRRGQGS